MDSFIGEEWKKVAVQLWQSQMEDQGDVVDLFVQLIETKAELKHMQDAYAADTKILRDQKIELINQISEIKKENVSISSE